MNVLYLISKLFKKIQIPAIKNSIIDKTARVCSGSHLVDVELGRYSYIGNFCTAINVKIGNFCSVADNCIIGGASHPIDWVSTSPVFHNGKNIMRKNFSELPYNPTKKTVIGNDVWLGNNCLIKSGITIGDGAVIGMGSVVTKDIDPYCIVAGNPAKIIRKRFDEKTINQLQKTLWWEFNQKKLMEVAKYADDVNLFIYMLIGER